MTTAEHRISVTPSERLNTILSERIAFGIPLYIYIPFLLIVLAAVFTNTLPDDMIGGSAYLFMVGGIFVYIGDRLPIWKSWFGGGIVFCLVVGMAIQYFALIPEPAYVTVNAFFSDGADLLTWAVTALIAGSILSMPRPYLVKAFPYYVPTVIGGLIFAGLFAFIGGAALGYGGIHAILTVSIPIQGGGMGAGGIPMSEIYASGAGTSFEQVFSIIAPAIIVGNIVAIALGGILNRIGQKRRSWSGDGVLLPEGKWLPDEGIDEEETRLTYEAVLMGWVVAVVLLTLGHFVAIWIPLHPFALMVIAAAVIKILGWLPNEVEQGAGHFYNFLLAGFLGPVLLGIGLIHIDVQVFLATLTPTYLALVTVAVFGAAFGAAVVGELVGMFPIEASLCGGLCMANMGGSGDVATLAAADRMELMSFAQISSRLGGGIMLLIANFAVSIWGSFLL